MSAGLWTIVLNWNQRDLTAACLRSLAGSVAADHHVVVVDNGSTDGSAEALRAEFPWAELILNGANLGFAEGNNVGIRRALAGGADLVWLLNNDTEVAPDCVAALLAAAGAHPEYALFAPKILFHDAPRTLWYAGGEVRLRRPAGTAHTGMLEADGPTYDRERRISFVTGCAFLIRRGAIEAIGELDAGLFIYCEDLDWSVKAQRRGLASLFVPGARVWHKVSRSYASADGRVVQTYLAARSRFIVQRRHASRAGTVALIPTFLLGGLARQAYRAAARGRFRPLVALAWGVRDGLTGRARRYP